MHGAVERVLADYEYRAKAGTGGKYYDGPIRIGPRRPDTPPAFLGASAEGTAGGVALPTDNPGGAPGGDPHHGHAH